MPYEEYDLVWSIRLDQGHSVRHTQWQFVQGIVEAIIFLSVSILISLVSAIPFALSLIGLLGSFTPHGLLFFVKCTR